MDNSVMIVFNSQSGLSSLWARPFPIINEGHRDLPPFLEGRHGLLRKLESTMTFSIICKGHAPSSKGHQSQCHGPLAIKETTLSRKAITGFTQFLGSFHSLQGPFQGPPFLGSFPVPWKAPLTVSDNPPCFRCNHYWPPMPTISKFP